MVKVYTGEALEFEGNVKETAEFIGVHYNSLLYVLSGKLEYLPQKAKCDFIVYKDEKIEKGVLKKDYYEVEVGLTYTVGSKVYSITDIREEKGKLYYEVNNDFVLTPIKRYTKYTTLYNATKRYVNNVYKNDIHTKK